MSNLTNEVADRYNTQPEFNKFRSGVELDCESRFGIKPSIQLVRLAYDFRKTINCEFGVKGNDLIMTLGEPLTATPKCNAA